MTRQSRRLFLDGVRAYAATSLGVAMSVLLPPIAAAMLGQSFVMPVAWPWVIAGSFAIAAFISFRGDRDGDATGETKRQAVEGKLRNWRARFNRNFHFGFTWQSAIGAFTAAATGGDVAVGVGGSAVKALILWA